MSADQNGGKTGWPPGMLQDDSKQLSNWLSTHGCARALAQEAAEKIKARRNMNITIYSKANCPNCVTAKQLLKSKGLDYSERDIEFHPNQFNELLKHYPDARQMPQIFIDGQRVGGLAGLQAALKQLGI